MVLHELGPLLVVAGVRVGPGSEFDGAVKGRHGGSGPPSRAGRDGGGEASAFLASCAAEEPSLSTWD